MKEDLVIYRLAKYLGNTFAFLLRHQAAILATMMFVLAFAVGYLIFRRHMPLAYSLVSAIGSSLLVSAFVLIRCRDYGED